MIFLYALLILVFNFVSEVLKQVWDLADQDNDSMLSLREFCIALFLMERYREGHALPPSLPNSLMVDETLMRMTGLPNSSHGNNAAWGAPSGTGMVNIIILAFCIFFLCAMFFLVQIFFFEIRLQACSGYPGCTTIGACCWFKASIAASFSA